MSKRDRERGREGGMREGGREGGRTEVPIKHAGEVVASAEGEDGDLGGA